MMFIEKLAQIDSACDFQQGRLRRFLSEKDQALYRYIDGYLNDYCRFYGLTPNDVQQVREGFVRQYQLDLANFAESRKYPQQLQNQIWTGGRVEYDVILIVSFLLEKHRFRMASWLAGHLHEKNILCIGIGPGVELGIVSEFLVGNGRKVFGYDVTVSDFVRSRYGDSVRQEYFHSGVRRYEAILLIEILEHLADPESLISLTAKSLSVNGRLFLTTAIDIPQFDHLYNFVPGEIVGMLANNGLQVDSLVEVGHVLNISSVRPANELVLASVRE
jgi:2-polyprenyl-3-methyl-5-hydroxy-6-metoxy-1,4-benzoquinol methylase